ncbi:MAG: response regulator transcription factor [Anaerolineae bacterium]|jgi:DNA-binding NarL/FixJ family response regulator
MRVLLADDQAKVRSALRLLLMHEPEVEIMGEAVDSTGLLDWVKVVCPDLILLDWELPGLPTGALLPLLHDHCPDLRVVALSSRPEARQAAFEAGADAFASKGDPPERVLAVIKEVASRQSEEEQCCLWQKRLQEGVRNTQ